MIKKISFKNNLGLNLSGIFQKPDNKDKSPLVVICHGIFSSKDGSAYVMLEEELIKAGIATFRFDFVNHGESEGGFENITLSQGIEDLKAALNTIKEYEWVDINRISLFGRSFGGNVVLKYISTHKNIQFVSLNAPASDLAESLEKMYAGKGFDEWETLGVVTQKFRDTERSLSYKIYSDAISQDTYELCKNVENKILIVHGDADDVVPIEQSIKLKESIGENAELKIIENADHEFKSNKMKQAIKLNAQFLIENINN